MTISAANRLSEVKEYYFSRKLREIAVMNEQGENVLSLAIGNPDNPPSPSTIQALTQHLSDTDAHSYQPTRGIAPLRNAMAKAYKRFYNVNINPDTEIQPLIGSKEGILHITLAFVNPGDEILVPNPGYPTYTSLPTLLGAKVRTYDLCEENLWQPDIKAIESTDLSKVKMMWINYPHMPTGAPALYDTFQQLVLFAKRHMVEF